MKLNEILKSLQYIKTVCIDDREISEIEYDSRKCTKGSLFIAISGSKTDGHKYIETAVKNGAIAVVCERIPDNKCIPGISYIIVEDSYRALSPLAFAFYGDPQSYLKIIGITGTNGKTSTSFYTRHIFESFGKSIGLIGTNGAEFAGKKVELENTTPDALQLNRLFREMVDSGVEYLVMEVSSHALSLGRVEGVEFDCVVFTNLSEDHLDFYSDMEEYFQAKRQLFFDEKAARIINGDDAYGKRLLNEFPKSIAYAIGSNGADFEASDIRQTVRGIDFDLFYRGETSRVSAKTPGLFSVYNTMCAISIATCMGLDFSKSCDAISKAEPVKGRFETVDIKSPYVIIIDYAHTPDGLYQVLSTLRNIPGRNRIITLFGAGGNRDKLKRPEMGKVVGELSDVAIISSDNPRDEDPSSIIQDIMKGFCNSTIEKHIIEDRAEAIRFAMDMAVKNDIILLAGKGHETYIIRNGIKSHFDEREIVHDYFTESQEVH